MKKGKVSAEVELTWIHEAGSVYGCRVIKNVLCHTKKELNSVGICGHSKSHEQPLHKVQSKSLFKPIY